MVLFFATQLFHLILPVEKIFIWPHFAIELLFIDNILHQSILGLDKLNLVVKCFYQLRKNVISSFIDFSYVFWIHFFAQTTRI